MLMLGSLVGLRYFLDEHELHEYGKAIVYVLAMPLARKTF